MTQVLDGTMTLTDAIEALRPLHMPHAGVSSFSVQ